MSIKKELACQAQFHGFKLNFINNFDDVALMNFQKESTAGEVMSNFFFFPQGSYKLCSKVRVHPLFFGEMNTSRPRMMEETPNGC